MGLETVFGVCTVSVIIFFDVMPRKKHFTNYVNGFYRILGISVMLRNYYFLLPGSTNKEFILLGI